MYVATAVDRPLDSTDDGRRRELSRELVLL
jgi:hypothetical protein